MAIVTALDDDTVKCATRLSQLVSVTPHTDR